ncbi:hypothetical protein CHH69_18775, partial [Terribacillus saccharophilus]
VFNSKVQLAYFAYLIIIYINTSTTINNAMITDIHPIFTLPNKRSIIKNKIAEPRPNTSNTAPQQQ